MYLFERYVTRKDIFVNVFKKYYTWQEMALLLLN